MSKTVAQALFKLTSLDWFVVLAGLGIVAALEVSKISPEPMNPSDKAFVDWGKDANGFGAFARGPRGQFGWTTGRSSKDAAREDALAYCETNGVVCRVIATQDTSVYNSILERPLSLSMQKYFEIYLGKPTPRAVAISEDGSIGYATGAVSDDVAIQTALKTCEHYRTQKNRPDFLTDRPCFVVHQSP